MSGNAPSFPRRPLTSWLETEKSVFQIIPALMFQYQCVLGFRLLAVHVCVFYADVWQQEACLINPLFPPPAPGRRGTSARICNVIFQPGRRAANIFTVSAQKSASGVCSPPWDSFSHTGEGLA